MRCSHSDDIQRLLFVVLAVTCFALPTASAADPELSSLQPYGFQRGTEVVAHFGGARLGDAEALLLYRPGIEVRELKPTGDNQVEAKLAIAADCPLGFHGLRVRTATGISNLQTLSVGALPEVQEVEPNSEFASPQTIELGCTVNGVIQNEDVDYYLVTVKKGQRISVELEGIRLGMPPNNGTFFDPFVAVLDLKRFELSRCDDAALLQQDCLCCIAAPEDGQYVIEVRESSYGGSDLCKYRLHVGEFPRPTAVLPAGGQAGESLQVRWIGDALGEWTTPLTIATDSGPDDELWAQDAQGMAPSPLRIRVNAWPNVLEVEPNEGGENATLFTAPAALNGSIDRPGDVDVYKFSAKKGETYDVRVYARQTLRSRLDSVLVITRSNGAAVGDNDDSGGPDSYLRFQAPEDDEYRVIIRDQLSDGAPDFVYRVEVAPVVPSLTLSLPERIQYVPVTVSVPRNNRMAVMVNAARANFGGRSDFDLGRTPRRGRGGTDDDGGGFEQCAGALLGCGRCAQRWCLGRSDWASRGPECECRGAPATAYHVGARPEQRGCVGTQCAAGGGGRDAGGTVQHRNCPATGSDCAQRGHATESGGQAPGRIQRADRCLSALQSSWYRFVRFDLDTGRPE